MDALDLDDIIMKDSINGDSDEEVKIEQLDYINSPTKKP